MKITFLASGNIRSNFSYRIVQLASALQKKGHAITIIAPSADKYNAFIGEKITTLNGVHIRQPFQFKTKHMIVNLIPYLISATWMMITDTSDLIYIYKPTPISVVGLFGKLFHGTPVVLDMDDLGSEVMKIEGHPWYQRILVSWSERLAAYYADKIIAASTFLHTLYKKSFPYKPVYVLPNGVDSGWFVPVKAKAQHKRVVFMGALNRKNILEPLLDVAPSIIKKYPDLEIVIMGDGSYFEYFKNKVTHLGIARNVTFTGWMDIAALKDNLLAEDIGYNYMPYDRTVLAASNMKVSQYMARGVVPLVSNMGDLPEAVEQGNAGYIAKPGNMADLEKTLLLALEDTHTGEKSMRARQQAEKRFDWNILADGVEQFLNPIVTAHDDNRKRVYVVTTNVPGNVGGPEIRNMHIVRQLSKNHNVSLFCINDIKQPSVLTAMSAVAIKRVQPIMESFRISGLAERFYAACQEQLPDIVHIEQISAYYSIRAYMAWLKERGVKIVLDTHNVEAILFEESLEIFPLTKKIIGKWLQPALRSLEIEATRQADIVLTCSDYDAEYFKQYNDHVYVVPNGVDCNAFIPVKKIAKDNILFIGGAAYPPNADAIRFFLTEIYPEIKNHIPDISFTIVGATRQWLKKEGFHDSSIEGVGFVDDIGPYLAKAAIGICPVRYGSGTRLKILTYMAAGLPVISTAKGSEGVQYNGTVVVADQPESFVSATLDILSNNMHYERLSAQGREFVVQYHDWNVVGKTLLSIYP